MGVGMLSPGGGYGAVEFHALHHYLLEYDSCGRQGMVHFRSVPSPHPPPSFLGEGRVASQKTLFLLTYRLRPPPPVLFHGFPYCPPQPPDPSLIYSQFLSRGDYLVDESLRRLGNPHVVTRLPFVRLRYGAPQLCKNPVLPRPRLTSGWTKKEAHLAPDVMYVLPWIGAAQTPQEHVVVGVVS